MGESEDLKQFVEGGDGISVIRGSTNCRGWNNIRYKPGLSEKNVGSTRLSMNVATIPPGGVAYAHIHVDFEVMLYLLQGKRHEYTDDPTKRDPLSIQIRRLDNLVSPGHRRSPSCFHGGPHGSDFTDGLFSSFP